MNDTNQTEPKTMYVTVILATRCQCTKSLITNSKEGAFSITNNDLDFNELGSA